MTSIPFRNWTCLFLLGLIFVAVSGQIDVGKNGGTTGQKRCDELRQQNTEMFLRANGRKIPGPLKDQLITRLVEFFLPNDCVRNVDPTPNFNPSSGRDHGGPLGTLGWEGQVFTTSQNSRLKRSVDDEEEDVGDEMDLTRAKRSADDEFTDEDMEMREKRSADDEDDFTDLEDNEEFREKRSTDEGDISNNEVDSLPLAREKRFLNGMTLGAPAAGPKPEVSESAQLMKTLLMLAKLQRKRASMTHRKVGGSGGYYGDRVSLGNGMYGDSYPGRKKRAATSEMEENLVASDEPLSRRKRFLFPPAGGEPGEGPPMPSMMSIMLGTARDPNTGKKIEFGGDRMKRMMTSSFMAATMPADAQPPPGKEPSDMVKNMAPVWYFSRMHMAMNPQVRRYMSDPGDYPQVRTSGFVQKRQRSGYYGDQLPGKKRRKRSADDNSDSTVSFAGPLDRKKRASSSDSSNNDVVTIGDVSIPIDFFKPRERSDDIKDRRPPYQQRPYRQPAYRQPAYRQPVYQQPRPQYYQGNYVQSPRYSAQQYSRYQQAKDRQTSQKLYQFIKALYDRQQYQKYLARIRSQQQANTLAQTQWNRQPAQYTLPTVPQGAPLVPQAPAPQQYVPPTQYTPPSGPLLQAAPQQSAPLALAPLEPAPMGCRPGPNGCSPGAPAPLDPAPMGCSPGPNGCSPGAPGPLVPAPMGCSPGPNGCSPGAPGPLVPAPVVQAPLQQGPLAPLPPARIPPTQPAGLPTNLLDPFALPPTQALPSPQMAPFLDPFISPTPPRGAPSPQSPPHRRVKRSDNKDNPERRNDFIFTPSLYQSVYSPYNNYVSPRYSTRSNKIGYTSGRGGVVYGDRLPWASRASPILRSRSRSRLPGRASSVQRNRAAPVNWYRSRLAPRLPALRVPAARVPAPKVPAPRVPAARVPAPRMPAPRVPAPRVPAARVPAPRVPASGVPAPRVPAPGVPAPVAPAPRVPAPVAPAPRVPAPLEPAPLLPGPVAPARLAPAPIPSNPPSLITSPLARY